MAKARSQESDKPGWRDQLSALRNIPPFLRLIWSASARLTTVNVVLRFLQAVLPPAILYVGKLIIDQVVLILDGGGDAAFLWQMVALEFVFALLSNLLTRGITLTDGLLTDLINHKTSADIMRHAATLDLYQFEDAEFYDKMERARRQTGGRSTLMSQLLAQFQSVLSILFLGATVVAFSPWLIGLIIIAVIPSFIQENYFNQQKYSLTRSWTPERREIRRG